MVVMLDSPMSKRHLTTVCQRGEKKRKRKEWENQRKPQERSTHIKGGGWFTRTVSLISVTKTDFFYSHQQFNLTHFKEVSC